MRRDALPGLSRHSGRIARHNAGRQRDEGADTHLRRRSGADLLLQRQRRHDDELAVSMGRRRALPYAEGRPRAERQPEQNVAGEAHDGADRQKAHRGGRGSRNAEIAAPLQTRQERQNRTDRAQGQRRDENHQRQQIPHGGRRDGRKEHALRIQPPERL